MKRPLRAISDHRDRIVAGLERPVHVFPRKVQRFGLEVVDGRRWKRGALIEPQRRPDLDGLTDLAHDFVFELLQTRLLKSAAQWIGRLFFAGIGRIRPERGRQDHRRDEHCPGDSLHVDASDHDYRAPLPLHADSASELHSAALSLFLSSFLIQFSHGGHQMGMGRRHTTSLQLSIEYSHGHARHEIRRRTCRSGM
jgi:hypothetical protein